MNEDADSVSPQITIGAPIEDVWRLITEAAHLQAWYAFDGATVDLREGGVIEHYWREHGRFRGVIEQLAPPTSLSYWYSDVPDADPVPGHQTLVTFRLTPANVSETVLQVTESGIRGLELSETERAGYLAATTHAWAGGLQALVKRARSSGGS